MSAKFVFGLGAILGLLIVGSATNTVLSEGNNNGLSNIATLDGIVSVTGENSEGGNPADGGQFCEADTCRVAAADGARVSHSLGGEHGERAEFSQDRNKDGWDRNGYVTFCPCIGNFGNQVELYLAALAFAKVVNRTLILPPFYHIHLKGHSPRRHHASVPFTDFFQVGAVQEFHRAIPMDEFLATLAVVHWPPSQRKIYAYPFQGECMPTQSEPFYKTLSRPVEFAECIPTKLRTDIDFSDESSRMKVKNTWSERFPPQDHPVLAFNGALGRFPVAAGNRFLQKYFRWTDAMFVTARTYISETFGVDSWVAVHLRNGGDWEKACDMDIEKKAYFMASPQCHEIKVGAVTKDLCLPSVTHILELTRQVFQDVKAKHLFIATDKHPHLEEFRALLEPLGVTVHHLNPDSPQVDLMVLGQADYFIGTCTSSFTSFVKRERDANGKPSIFWGQEYKGFS